MKTPDYGRSQKEGYHAFRGDTGSFEVFWEDQENTADMETGWYWWACFPGCLPDGDQSGPFNTSTLAYEDAKQ
jgi:hypothetical protein